MYTTVLYHKNCNDGLIAALNFYAYFKEHDELDYVTFKPVQHGEGLPDESLLKGREVFVVDFSYPRQDMAKLVELATEVILLDHHETAIQNLFTGKEWLQNHPTTKRNQSEGEYLKTSARATILINKNRSGATLAYDEVGMYIDNDNVREILDYLSNRAEDRDNWVFDYNDSKAVHQYIKSLGSDLKVVYDKLFSGDINDVFSEVNKAQVRVYMHQELTEKYAKLAKPISFMGYTVPAINVPSDFSSAVGDILDKGAAFAIMYTVTDQKVLVSLRSDKVNGVDVQEIASVFSGGGHRNAAGFSIEHSELSSLLEGRINVDWLPANKSNGLRTSLAEVLIEEFMIPLGMGSVEFAEKIGIDESTMGHILYGGGRIDQFIARKLADAFDSTPEFWLNIQNSPVFKRS